MSLSRRSDGATITKTAVSGIAVLASAGVLSFWFVNRQPVVASTSMLLIFVLFVALADLLEIPLERRAPFSLALAPAIAFGLLRTCSDGSAAAECERWTTPHLGEVLIVFLLGTGAACVVRAVRRSDLQLKRFAVGTIVTIAGAGAYRVVLWVAPERLTFGPPNMSVFGLTAVLFVVLVMHIGIEAALGADTSARSLSRELREGSRATAALLLSTVSVGALLALAYPAFEVWTFPLFLAPLSATHFSFKQVATIRKNYLQTIRALSKVPEMAGYTVRGHSSRVARLSIEIASELGVGDPELHEIEYAALLHDIGRVSLSDPGEASPTTAGLELARVGAEIVENTGHFPEVAQMVRDQHEPYRRRGEDANSQLALGGKIIKVASAFDDLTEPGGPGRTRWDALERLHMGMAYEYDPSVIQALTRVLEQRGLV